MSANALTVEDCEPWYLRPRDDEPSRHLQVWCGNAYLLVRKSDGLVDIGYRDESSDSGVIATRAEMADWLRVMRWYSEQTFPWKLEDSAE